MVGTGIFTSLGFQVGPLPSGFVIMALWLTGGLCALCGALSYAELGAAMPRCGGEYHFLGTIFHPALGFVAGWISATAGFTAPAALAAIAFGKYLAGVVPGVPPLPAAFAVVWVATAFLLGGTRLGSWFQNLATWVKVALLLGIVAAGWLVGDPQPVAWLPRPGDMALVGSAPFAASLIYVMYAYSGWNASTYIAGEVRNPSRTIPLSVGIGCALVVVVYLGVNAAMLRSTPMAELDGKVEVALTAGPHLFGAAGARVMAALICIGLVSTVSAMMWIGPRVMVTMGEDLRGLRWFALRSRGGIPVVAILVQFGLVNAGLSIASFEQVLTCAQFTLQLCAFLTVLGVIVLRRTRPDLPRPYRTWGYPFTPLCFLAVSLWMLWHTFNFHRAESLAGLGIAAAGLALYLLAPVNRRTAQRGRP